jgi:hypothetical protein
MSVKASIIAALAALLLVSGCGESEGVGPGHMPAEEAAAEAEASECDPNYSGACLDPYSSDYDCEGGSGNGPDYTGEVTVVGVDHYGLDADGDGIGCESY